MKVVINSCYGGFSISPEAALWLFARGFEEKGFKTSVEDYWTWKDGFDEKKHAEELQKWREYLNGSEDAGRRRGLFLTVYSPDEKLILNTRPENRAAPLLVECVEALKERSYGGCAELRIVEIPDGVDWAIDEYDGMESVHEKHRSWA